MENKRIRVSQAADLHDKICKTTHSRTPHRPPYVPASSIEALEFALVKTLLHRGRTVSLAASSTAAAATTCLRPWGSQGGKADVSQAFDGMLYGGKERLTAAFAHDEGLVSGG